MRLAVGLDPNADVYLFARSTKKSAPHFSGALLCLRKDSVIDA